MDWINTLPNIQDKIKFQLHAKKIDDLERLYSLIQEFDTDNSGFLDKAEFSRFLSKLGVFLSTQELRSLYNQYDLNKDNNINYAELINLIKTSISEKRLAAVKHAFNFVLPSGQSTIPLEYLISRYKAEFHPRVTVRQKTAEQVRTEFVNAITKKSKGGIIDEKDFLEYYLDVNATLPHDKEEYFIDMIFKTWGITSSESYVSPERIANLEALLFEKIRQKTLEKEDEGKTIRKQFKYFDIYEKGVIDLNQFSQVLSKFGCVFSESEKVALFQKYDKEKSGKINYDEFCNMVAFMGSASATTNPVFEINRKPPVELLQKIKEALRKRGKGTVRGLRKIFKKADKNKNQYLDRTEFTWCIKEVGLGLTKTEYDKIFRYFDKNCDDKISYNEFMAFFSQDLTEGRLDVIKKAFAKLDLNANGAISIDEIKRQYNVSAHYEESGKKRAEDLLNEFISQWDVVNKDRTVTLQEFIEFYKDISSNYESCEAFVEMMTKSWRL